MKKYHSHKTVEVVDGVKMKLSKCVLLSEIHTVVKELVDNAMTKAGCISLSNSAAFEQAKKVDAKPLLAPVYRIGKIGYVQDTPGCAYTLVIFTNH